MLFSDFAKAGLPGSQLVDRHLGQLGRGASRRFRCGSAHVRDSYSSGSPRIPSRAIKVPEKKHAGIRLAASAGRPYIGRMSVPDFTDQDCADCRQGRNQAIPATVALTLQADRPNPEYRYLCAACAAPHKARYGRAFARLTWCGL